jgi:CelD/BcsL family acetyltransferase involved in cellulose biosynthesis
MGIARRCVCLMSTVQQMQLETEIIRDPAQLKQLKREWLALAAEIPHVTPFQLPEWGLTWLQHFGSGELRTLLFRCGSRIVGLLPAFIHPWRGQKQMTLIGSGISDYPEPLIDPGFANEAIEALGEHLESDSAWQVCEWQDLTESSPLLHIQPRTAFRTIVKQDIPCTKITLSKTFEEFWNSRPRHVRRNVTRYRRHASEHYAVAFETVTGAVPELFESFIRLHGNRWQLKGESGMIEENHSAPFLWEIAKQFERLKILRFFVLRFNREIAAIILAWDYRNNLYFYLSGFDPRFAEFRPGQILLCECLRYAYSQNCESCDFLRGAEPYKLDWGAVVIPKYRVILTRHRDKPGTQHSFCSSVW